MKRILLLIVAIVFLSLCCSEVDNANGEFSEELEYKVLTELRLDLIQNLNDINSNIKALEASENANRIVIHHMEKDLPYNDSLDYHFANLYPYLVFSPNETTFSYLKKTGMLLISNDSIRAAVSDLYGVQFGIYKSYESIYFVEHYTNYIKPMFIAEFETFKFYRSFKPKKYSEFIKNQEYKRIMNYTADAIQTFKYMQSNLKSTVEKIIQYIDKEIN
jgi:hypothetical protein